MFTSKMALDAQGKIGEGLFEFGGGGPNFWGHRLPTSKMLGTVVVKYDECDNNMTEFLVFNSQVSWFSCDCLLDIAVLFLNKATRITE